jgi:hypothetical protein
MLLSCLGSVALAQSSLSGVIVKVRLLDALDASSTKDGQSFSATLVEPLNLGGKTVLKPGARLRGRAIQAPGSEQFKRPPCFALVLTSADNASITTEPLRIEKEQAALSAGAELTFSGAKLAASAERAPEPALRVTSDQTLQTTLAKWRDDSREENDDAFDALIFSEHDQWLIRSYFRTNYGNLPPGLSNRGEGLSPALEKHMRRDDTLPSSLEDRAVSLPAELERQLPRLPVGYARVAVAGRVMILSGDDQIVDLMFIYH